MTDDCQLSKENMMVCRKCGFDNSDNAKYCEQCGEALEVCRNAAEEQNNNHYYEEPGISQRQGLSSDIPAMTEIPISEKGSDSKKSINPLIIVIPAGILFVIIAAIIVFTAFKFVSKHFLQNNRLLREEKYVVEEMIDEIEDELYENDSLPDMNSDTIQGTTDLSETSIPQTESEVFGENTDNITYNTPNNTYADIQTAEDEQQNVDAWSYVLPDSNTRYLSVSELQQHSASELRLARNEI